MKLRGKIIVGLLALAAICAFLLLSTGNPAQRELEETRRSLRQQGFKTELGEFNLASSDEVRQRAAVLGTTTRAALTNRQGPGPIRTELPGLLSPAGKDTALVLWRQEKLKSYRGDDLWPELREIAKTDQARLEAARQAALSGPIRFEPIGRENPSPGWLLPYLADLKRLETTFAALTMLALHDGQRDEAWTNLLAGTCLVTAYTPEPLEISHMVRFACAAIACDTTWNALQSHDWTEAQLADLQHRWEAVDFWSGLPETAALSRVNMAGALELERRESLSLGITLPEALNSPRYVWSALTAYWRQLGYRNPGSYKDEKAMLLYYRDRELELRRAVRSPTWDEMRQLPGVTNLVPFKSKYPSRVQSMMNLRQMTLNIQGQGQGLLGRAAEVETERRLTIAAIALERYRARRGSYPEVLQALVPELPTSLPSDFMDGKPLRYQRTDEGQFVLYSVGLDCVDNGGQMRQPRRRGEPNDEFAAGFGSRTGTDLVWPRPASEAEAERLHQEEKKGEEAKAKDAEEAQAAAWWDITTRRQSNVEEALAAPPLLITNEPVYGGRRLSQVLSNRPGTNEAALFELLTLKQVPSGEEPETVAFELPIKYEALTNRGSLGLCIDRYGPDYEEGWRVGHDECVRATNGDCRLVWSTIYETPGKHALLAVLELQDPTQAEDGFFGPVTPFVVSNLCQFTPESASFDPERGAKFYARLPELNGAYRIDLKSPAGESLRTITGSTTNGFIEAHWDLTDDHGQVCTNEAYDSVFHITLPDSGRSQTLKGP